MLALLALLVPPAHAADIVVFGDSWAAGAADELQEVLADRGLDLTVSGHGVGGTTAEHWADVAPSALHEAVTANPGARWVWLSIGGNDLFQHYQQGIGYATDEDNDTHIRKMLDDLFAVHPDVRVVMIAYDFVNLEQSADCILQAWLYFGTDITTPAVNSHFVRQVGDVQQAIAADHDQVTYVPVWGTLQAAGGVPNAPNAALPSPAGYFADCIHPNHTGYTLIHEVLVDAYWGDPDSEAWPQDTDTDDTAAEVDTAVPDDEQPAPPPQAVCGHMPAGPMGLLPLWLALARRRQSV